MRLILLLLHVWGNLHVSLSQNELKCLVPEIENGYITEEASEYRENEILYFRCNRTFKRREDRPSKCTKVGMRAEWSPTPECEPTKCVLQLPPLEGTTYEPAFKSVFVPGETLRVTCEGRFWIFSSRETVAETTCNDDGQWTINPVCKEVVCTNEREYNVRRWDVWWGQRIVMGDTVEYSCIADYESSDGSNLAKCTREGWKPKPLCQEIICHRMDIENAVNRDPYSLTYKNNKRVYYECREGFTGSPFRTCTANGWTGDSRCTEITCNRKYYSYAVIEGTDKSVYKYNEQVDYVCNNGYVGRFTLTCGKGRWKGTQSCMKGKPCNRPELMDANIRGADKQSYSNNEKIQYVCTYSQEVREAKCEEGVWTGITKCSACPKAVIPHGFAVGAQGDKLTYTCDEGYKLFNKGWWGEATCVNHLWSGLEQCIGEMQCGEIPAIANGEALTIQKPYDENESTEIRCNEGFEAQVTRLSCHEGEWSSDGSQLNTICTARASNCDAPPKVDNAIITTTYKNNYLTDSEVVYECRNKYMLVGEGSLRCLGRKWEEKNITCALYCDLPKDHTITFKVHKDRFVDGEVLQYQCSENGEYLNATCVDGKWDKTVECDGKPCNRPELMDANIRGVVKQSYSNNDKIQYDCTNSQEVHEAKCEEGVWTGITNCSELKCLVPEIENGYITEEAREYRENEILHFSCNEKFKRREDRPSKCTKVGMRAEWSPTPECEPIKCLLQLPPLEGTTYEPAFKSVFVPGETLRVTCEGRFNIVSPQETAAETTCNDDGQWTINPVCKGLKTRHDAADSR